MHLYDLWFTLIAVLWVGYFFLEGFDFGIGVLTQLMARNHTERRVLINTIAPVWDGNEVWVISAAGATFAAFPDWYATMFSGFYIPLLIILICLIARGVSFEYRGKRSGDRWQRNWEQVTFWTSVITPFMWGLIFANIVRGLAINADKSYVGAIGDLFNGYAILGGFVTLALFTCHGAIFAALKTDGEIRERARKLAPVLGLVSLLLMLAFLLWTQVNSGNGQSLGVMIVSFVALLVAMFFNQLGREGWAFVFSGLTIVASFAMLFLTLFPEVMPSTLNPDWSLTVSNSSSAPYTLTVMTIVTAVFVPLVLLYQGWTYWVFRKRIAVHHIPAGH
ncbi:MULTISPECIES: cytochrome d ubiquinol oxidase subunit II [Streptomyces]|uniref:Cytochrome d ubiquinol oxidase subunit II n=1 Tax=Streptomyces dengpaensis TaxID=2049881 RepID=A0ABM6SKJ2_9ACTN|nr:MULTISPECIES: cytochrome d ubiquinol oxidase subunit II [Streptomyces]AVH54861.1 cytochrome d ubiquinol oxidase subunit II [Streptomyces dengpaensis]PIB03285.1 cytochrome d ubiquinol oxidase subunit II [Streptomyces sp. HG99]